MLDTDTVSLEADGPMFVCEPHWIARPFRCWRCDPMWGDVRRHRHRRRDRIVAAWPGGRVAYVARQRNATAARRVDRRAARRRHIEARRNSRG